MLRKVKQIHSNLQGKYWKYWLPVLIIITGFLVCVYVAYKFFLSPARTLSKSLSRLGMMRTFSYLGQLKFKANTSNNSQQDDSLLEGLLSQEYTLGFTGSADFTNKNNKMLNGHLDIAVKQLPVLQADYAVVGKTIYLKIEQMADLGIIGLENFKDKWIQIDPQELNNIYGISVKSPNILSLSYEDELTLQKFIEINPPIVFVGRLHNEKIAGVESYQYKFKIDKTNLVRAYAEALSLSEFDDETKAARLESIKGNINKLDFGIGALWIGKKDFLIRKFQINVKTVANNKGDPIYEANLTLILNDINYPIKIFVPQDSTRLRDMLSGYINSQTPSEK